MSIYTEMHNKYGNPYYVAEFRLFNLNDCFKSCESCFYKRSGNSLNNYEKIKALALDLKTKNYQLETCYLLPTDFFENDENYTLAKSKQVQDILREFLYTGIASTLEGEINYQILLELLEDTGVAQIELQINLITEKLFNLSYFKELKFNIEKGRNLLGDKIVFNLALNLGRKFSEEEYQRIQYFVTELSDDGILEINFTYLYNELLNQKVKEIKLKESLISMKRLAKMYNREESRFNDRTLLRKPAFIFKKDKTYLAPIIPFDEYVFSDEKIYELNDLSMNGFLETLNNIESINKPILNECESCDLISTCMGKNYFAAAHTFKLPCFIGV